MDRYAIFIMRLAMEGSVRGHTAPRQEAQGGKLGKAS